ncbi:MAG: DUF4388 domain-containing protein [Actinobacteria bacterium]|nr:DUF4388 domain-containing protein [Actinomycetota bacterium]
MPLKGNLKDFSLPDLFQLIHFGKKSGKLTISRGDIEGYVCFRDGDVTYATHNTNKVLIGQLLVRARVVTDKQVAEALELQKTVHKDKLIGSILVELKYITDETLELFIKEQIKESVFNLLMWNDGAFDFDPDDKLEEDIGVSMGAEELIRESRKRLGEWMDIESRIPTLDAIFSKTSAGKKNPERLKIPEEEVLTLEYIDGTNTVRDIARQKGEPALETCKSISNLAGAKLIKLVGEKGGESGGSAETLQEEIDFYEEESATLTETKPPDEGTLEYYKWLALQEAMNCERVGIFKAAAREKVSEEGPLVVKEAPEDNSSKAEAEEVEEEEEVGVIKKLVIDGLEKPEDFAVDWSDDLIGMLDKEKADDEISESIRANHVDLDEKDDLIGISLEGFEDMVPEKDLADEGLRGPLTGETLDDGGSSLLSEEDIEKLMGLKSKPREEMSREELLTFDQPTYPIIEPMPGERDELSVEEEVAREEADSMEERARKVLAEIMEGREGREDYTFDSQKEQEEEDKAETYSLEELSDIFEDGSEAGEEEVVKTEVEEVVVEAAEEEYLDSGREEYAVAETAAEVAEEEPVEVEEEVPVIEVDKEVTGVELEAETEEDSLEYYKKLALENDTEILDAEFVADGETAEEIIAPEKIIREVEAEVEEEAAEEETVEEVAEAADEEVAEGEPEEEVAEVEEEVAEAEPGKETAEEEAAEEIAEAEEEVVEAEAAEEVAEAEPGKETAEEEASEEIAEAEEEVAEAEPEEGVAEAEPGKETAEEEAAEEIAGIEEEVVEAEAAEEVAEAEAAGTEEEAAETAGEVAEVEVEAEAVEEIAEAAEEVAEAEPGKETAEEEAAEEIVGTEEEVVEAAEEVVEEDTAEEVEEIAEAVEEEVVKAEVAEEVAEVEVEEDAAEEEAVEEIAEPGEEVSEVAEEVADMLDELESLEAEESAEENEIQGRVIQFDKASTKQDQDEDVLIIVQEESEPRVRLDEMPEAAALELEIDSEEESPEEALDDIGSALEMSEELMDETEIPLVFDESGSSVEMEDAEAEKAASEDEEEELVIEGLEESPGDLIPEHSESSPDLAEVIDITGTDKTKVPEDEVAEVLTGISPAETEIAAAEEESDTAQADVEASTHEAEAQVIPEEETAEEVSEVFTEALEPETAYPEEELATEAVEEEEGAGARYIKTEEPAAETVEQPEAGEPAAALEEMAADMVPEPTAYEEDEMPAQAPVEDITDELQAGGVVVAVEEPGIGTDELAEITGGYSLPQGETGSAEMEAVVSDGAETGEDEEEEWEEEYEEEEYEYEDEEEEIGEEVEQEIEEVEEEYEEEAEEPGLFDSMRVRGKRDAGTSLLDLETLELEQELKDLVGIPQTQKKRRPVDADEAGDKGKKKEKKSRGFMSRGRGRKEVNKGSGEKTVNDLDEF